MFSRQVACRWGHGTRPCHTSLSDPQTQNQPFFFFALKQSSMFWVSKTARSTVDFPHHLEKSSLVSGEQWINNGFDTSVDKPFKDLIGDIKQRDWMIALWVLSGFWGLWDSDNKNSSPDYGYSEVARARRQEATWPGF